MKGSQFRIVIRPMKVPMSNSKKFHKQFHPTMMMNENLAVPVTIYLAIETHSPAINRM